ncbi:MAG: DUF3850 domain-containing protein [Christensenellaceae bacterium]|jgi:ParB family chromosome partitioning protein|nr:DUF3850 domain-containing protein [Christensenellaceae bacterium]
MTHELKLCKKFYEPVVSGNKTFELRKNDRNFKVGDKLILRPVTDDETRAYINNLPKIHAEISYMLSEGVSGGLEKGYCVLAMKNVQILNEEK